MMAIAWNRESKGHWSELDREVLCCSVLMLMATGLLVGHTQLQRIYHDR